MRPLACLNSLSALKFLLEFSPRHTLPNTLCDDSLCGHAESCGMPVRLTKDLNSLPVHKRATVPPSPAHAWNAHEIAPLRRDPVPVTRARGSLMSDHSIKVRVQIAAMWVFLGPLIVILGTVDRLTNGRSRNWP
jgi:hypothetical protein